MIQTMFGNLEMPLICGCSPPLLRREQAIERRARDLGISALVTALVPGTLSEPERRICLYAPLLPGGRNRFFQLSEAP